MNTVAFSGQAAAQSGYITCQHTPARMHLTGFNTLAEAHQYLNDQQRQSAAARHATLLIVQTCDDRVMYLRQPETPSWLDRFINLFV